MKPVVEGADRITEMFAKMPGEMKREMKVQMRRASKPWLTRMKASAPHPEWKQLAKINVKQLRKHAMISCMVGFFGSKRDKDRQSEWMKLYWDNYGTLTRRDPQHTFGRPIRRNTNPRNWRGQPHRNFYDKAMEGAADDIAEKTIRGLEKFIDKL